jgi:transposase
MAEQLGFAEALVDRRLGSNAKLARIDQLIEWTPLGALVAPVRSGETGRPPYDALAMMKALYLQALYDLSDPGLEEALLDRLSFRRFCGFGLDTATPDETTICRFRASCAKAGVLEACFAEVNRQLEARANKHHPGVAVLDAAPERADRAAAGAGRSCVQRHEAALRQGTRPMSQSRTQRRRLLRLPHRLQSAPRQLACHLTAASRPEPRTPPANPAPSSPLAAPNSLFLPPTTNFPRGIPWGGEEHHRVRRATTANRLSLIRSCSSHQ